MANSSVAQTAFPPAQWDAFLSHLAIAENSAAQQFTLIAQGLTAEGHADASQRYHALAREEQGHYERVCRACREFIPPPDQFLKFYGSESVADGIPFVQRMAVAHFAQETAALAFLGHIHGHIHEYMNDAEWALQLRQLCAGILCEEVQHVKEGRDFVAQFLPGQSEPVRKQVRAAVRLHRRLIIQSARGWFAGAGHPFVDAMIASYNRRFQSATADIL